MNIAPRIQDYLAERQIAYELRAHPRTATSGETALVAHVPPGQVAKAVVMKDEFGYVLAAVPASRHIAGAKLGNVLRRHGLHPASEWEVATLFGDCAYGAVPPLGEPYGLLMVVDEALDDEPDVYFEAGDHQHLVHITHSEFLRMTADAPRASFAKPNE